MSSEDELIQIVIQESTNTQQQLERDQLNAAILASQAEQERVRREKEKEERSLSRSGDVASYYEDSILISNSTFVNHVLRLVRRFVKCLPIHINQSTTTTDEIKEWQSKKSVVYVVFEIVKHDHHKLKHQQNRYTTGTREKKCEMVQRTGEMLFSKVNSRFG